MRFFDREDGMIYARMGSTDLQVSRICFGTLWMGGVDEDDAVRAVRRALDLGVTFFDTADGYGGGTGERLLARGLEGRRHDVVLATKGGIDSGQFGDRTPRSTEPHSNMAGKPAPGRTRNSHPGFIAAAIDASLERLRTDYVDLYYIHYPNTTVPWADTIGALQDAQRAGKIRYVGVSNFALEQVEGWRRAGPLHAYQPMYNMLERSIERDVLPYCREAGIAVFPYSTLAHGLLTAKYADDHRFGEKDLRPQLPVFAGASFARNLALARRLADLAKRLDMTGTQLVLGWTLAQPGITAALTGPKKPEHIEESAAAADRPLSADALREIDALLAGARTSEEAT
jgi:aryl-alcohol dehydrogenase-like predicted oxidoreductase